MLFLLIFVPVISTSLILVLGNFFGRKGSVFISCFNMAYIFGILLVFFYKINLQKITVLFFVNWWVSIINFNIMWSFLCDSIGIIMFFVVLFISLLVQVYSFDYMFTDCNYSRFFAYLSLFTFFMLILISGNNLLQLFLGWEGVGLCSYLLINFWYSRIQANKSALKALFVNRIGDFFLLLGISLLYWMGYSLNYSVIFQLIIGYLSNITIICWGYLLYVQSLICLFFFLGAVGKSAQIGLHLWLPDAMEGPTPVSALIHAATMVTAGVFLIIRFSILFELTKSSLFFLFIIGALTSIFAASIGLFQHDIKKVIAYSTCSQLGYMFLICGLSQYTIALYHLTTHAFFKALLFLGAGAIIHSLQDEQDIRKYGRLSVTLPLTFSTFAIASSALMGLSFLSGYFSKDLILEFVFTSYRISGFTIYFIMLLSITLSLIYSMRLIGRIFFSWINGYRKIYSGIIESQETTLCVLIILSLCSIFIGYYFSELFSIIGNNFFHTNFFFKITNNVLFENELIYYKPKIIPSIFCFEGIIWGWVYYVTTTLLTPYEMHQFKMENAYNFSWLKRYTFIVNYSFLYNFFIKKWYYDFIINFFFVNIIFNISLYYFFFIIDKGFLELLGPLGFYMCLFWLMENLLHETLLQNRIYQYLCMLYVLIGYLFLFFIL